MKIEVTSKKFLIFGEERFKVTDWSTNGLKDPFDIPAAGRYVIDENSGGGIKGILSVVARYVNAKISKKPFSNQNVKQRWGTSTGGIIQASLCMGLSTEDLIKFYVEDGPVVFDEAPGGMITYGAKFAAEKLEAKLKSIFKDITMKEIVQKSGVELYLTAYDVVEKKTVIFSSNGYYGEDTSNIPVWVAVRATMAAPFYFRPLVWHDPVRKIDRVFQDGGVTGMNCSAGLAYMKALTSGIKPNEMHILSVGTGFPQDGKTREEVIKDVTSRFGYGSRAGALLDAMMDSTTTFTLQSLTAHEKDLGLGFQRWNVALPSKTLNEMDNTDNINELFELAVSKLKA